MLICKNCIFAKKIITYRYIIVNIAKAQSVFTTFITVRVLLLQQNWFHLQIERINKKTGNKNKRIFRKKHIHPLKQPREYWGGCKKAFLRGKDKAQQWYRLIFSEFWCIMQLCWNARFASLSGNRIYQAYTNIRAPELLIILDMALFVWFYYCKMPVNAW